ncbi:MAG: phosphatidylglycerol lysyltransferase domain-containing protein [Firmicutes bacterium]|nr:phosphatidylglycerol lysyltransferase domain-containing protein [Bacillota bacterium]
MTFRKLSLEDKAIFDRYNLVKQGYFAYDLTFAMVWIEDVQGETEICDLGDITIIRTMCCGKRIYLAPLVRQIELLYDAIKLIRKECEREKTLVEIYVLSDTQKQVLETTYKTISNPDESDYIYNAKDLINLVGKKYHSKRNFIKRFKNSYNYDFRMYNPDIDNKEIIKLYEKWKSTTSHDTWSYEFELLTRALDFYTKLDLKITVLYIEDELVAFSINHIQPPILAHTLFEKADTSYLGAYQAINQFTAQELFNDVEYVNRQDDLGIMGLRKAKQSYYPVMMVTKHSIHID